MKRLILVLILLQPLVLRAQDFLTPGTWWFNDTIMPLNDYNYRYKGNELRTQMGILAWQNDTIAFAEYHHFKYYRLYVMKAPRHWVRKLEQLAKAATMTANYFVGDLTGGPYAMLYTPGRTAINDNPIYGRALQLDKLMDSIIVAVMHNDSASMCQHIIAADKLGYSFRCDYPLSWYRPSVGIGYAYRGKTDFFLMEQEDHKRWQWMEPLSEQYDLFLPYGFICSDAPAMFLEGKYLSVALRCDREVDSVMINQFALDRREEFVQLSRTLCVDGYEPKVEITLSDTITQRQCFVDEWHCRIKLPSTDCLSDVVPPINAGYYLGASTQTWKLVDEQMLIPWWK